MAPRGRDEGGVHSIISLKRLGVVVEWEYEPEEFWFLEVPRGVRSYKPDFRVTYKGEPEPVYVEVKGYMGRAFEDKISEDEEVLSKGENRGNYSKGVPRNPSKVEVSNP
jgi:hypothetical protein